MHRCTAVVGAADCLRTLRLLKIVRHLACSCCKTAKQTLHFLETVRHLPHLCCCRTAKQVLEAAGAEGRLGQQGAGAAVLYGHTDSLFCRLPHVRLA